MNILQSAPIQHLIDTVNNSIKSTVYPQSQAELATGVSYSYVLAFNNQLLKTSIDQLFVHTMRMLCVLACVIEETALPSNLTTNLSAGSTAVSPPPPPPITVPVSGESAQNPNLAAANSASSRSASPSFIRSKFSSITDSSKNAKNSSAASSKDQRKPSITSTNSSTFSQADSASLARYIYSLIGYNGIFDEANFETKKLLHQNLH